MELQRTMRSIMGKTKRKETMPVLTNRNFVVLKFTETPIVTAHDSMSSNARETLKQNTK